MNVTFVDVICIVSSMLCLGCAVFILGREWERTTIFRNLANKGYIIIKPPFGMDEGNDESDDEEDEEKK